MKRYPCYMDHGAEPKVGAVFLGPDTDIVLALYDPVVTPLGDGTAIAGYRPKMASRLYFHTVEAGSQEEADLLAMRI